MIKIYNKFNLLYKMENKETQYFRLIDLVNHTPSLKWDYKYLSSNKNITLTDITNNLKPTPNNNLAPFYKYYISSNPNLTLEFILKYPDDSLDYGDDENMSDLSPGKWNWDYIISNKAIKFNEIKDNLNLPWDYYYYLSERFENETTDYDFILTHSDKHWNWHLLTTYVDPIFIFAHQELPWVLINISQNIRLQWPDIKSHPDFKWDFDYMCLVLPLEDLIFYDIPINYYLLSMNPTLTSEYFLAHINEKWNNSLLINNPGLNFDMLADSSENLSVLCNFTPIFGFPKMTFKFIGKYYNFYNNLMLQNIHRTGIITLQNCIDNPRYLDYKLLSVNPTLTLNFVINNINEDWDFQAIFSNKAFKIWDLENPNVTYNYIIENAKIIELYLQIKNSVNMSDITYIMSNNKYNFELKKRKIVEKIIVKFKKKMINKWLLSDLSNIIITY
jgi:hypothetical protein